MSKTAQARFRVAVLVSGGGSNLEALLHASDQAALPRADITLVISNRADAGALVKAKSHGVETVVVLSKGVPDEMFQSGVFRALTDHRIDIVCLAGYLKKLSPEIVRAFPGRILNIHPALLPKYGGAGMYGHFVHEAVLKAGETESGCSVHVVDEEFDHGRVLAQARVPVLPDDTPARLAERILKEEHRLYPIVLKQFCEHLAATGRPS